MKFIFQTCFHLIFTVVLGHSIHAQTEYTFEQVLKTAKANNPTLKSEELEIAIAESDLISARIRPNLVLSNETIQMTNSAEFASGTSWSNPENREVLWQLSKEFQLWGQRHHKIDVADKSYALSKYEYEAFEKTVLFEVAEKWNEVWTTQKHLELIEMAKNNVDSLVITNQIRFKNQVITQTDVFRTELLAKQYALQYATEHQKLVNRKKELQFLMGISGSVDIDTNQNFEIHNLMPSDGLTRQSLDTRSDIQSAKSFIDLSESNIQLQRSLAYPTPEIGVIYNSQNKIPHFGFAATIDLPFFDRNQGEIKKSQIQKDQAERQLLTLQTQIETEISTAHDSYQTHRANIVSFKSVLEQSQTILDNVKYAYLKGGTSIIDFLEAQRSWLETQEQYNEALEHYRQSYIYLLYVTGLINQLAQ